MSLIPSAKKNTFFSVSLDIWAFILFFTVAACLFYASMFRWGDLIVDTFREFYLPSAILKGKILYRDIYYEYGFFAPYFNAAWFKLFGVSILSLALCGFITLMASVMAIYKLSAMFMSKLLSCLVGVIFLLVFAFGQYVDPGIFNFILPYSFASIFFITFIAWGLYFFIKFIVFEKFSYLVAWAVLVTLAFTARIEFSLLAWVGFFISFLIRRSVVPAPSSKSKIIFLPLISAVFFYAVFFLLTRSFWGFKKSFFDFLIGVSNVFYARGILGLADFHGNLLAICRSLLVQLVIFSSALIGAFFSKLVLFKSRSFWRISLTIVICFLSILVGIVLIDTRSSFFIQYDALPIMLIFGLVVVSFKLKKNADFNYYLSVFTLFVISLFMVLRMFFLLTISVYGFFLMVPGIVAYYLFYYRIVGNILIKQMRYFSYPVYAGILSFIFLFQALWSWGVAYSYYAAKDIMVNTDKGAFYSYNNMRTARYWLTVSYLLKYTKPSDTVVVVPEGIGINFFSNRQNPSPYTWVQAESSRIYSEDKIIDDFTRLKVDYFVLLARETRDHGAAFFGIHYAQALYAWILNNYTLIQQFGPYPFTSKEFGVAIFKRKS